MIKPKNTWVLMAYTALFHGGMTVSKTLHPLWFEMNENMELFGVSYSLMALAGYFSFFAGPLADRFGPRAMLIWGSVLYGVGLALRIFPDSSYLAAASGLTAGLGASAALVSLKPWIMNWASEGELGTVVGKEGHATSIGAAGGLVIAGVLAATLGDSKSAVLSGLLLAALGPFLASLVISRTKKHCAKNPGEGRSFKESFAQLLNEKKLAFATASLALLTGFYMALVGPYVPLLLKEQGLTLLPMIGAMLLLTLVRIYAIPKFTSALNSKKIDAKYLFLWGELSFAGIMFTFYWEQALVVLLFMLCLRSVAMAASAFGEQLGWMRIYSKKQAAVFFSLAQGCYFLGDAAGGLLAGWSYDTLGALNLMVVGAILVAANAVLTFLYFWSKEKLRMQMVTEYGDCASVC